MIKAASTTNIIQLLRGYEEAYGPGVVTSIGSVCTGNRYFEYIIHVKDSCGMKHRINVPSIDEEKFWEWQRRVPDSSEAVVPDAIIDD